MEKKRAWKNRIMAFVLVAVFMVSVFSTTLVSNAAESITVIQDAFEEPYVGENAGYINILVEDKDSSRYVYTYTWNFTVLSDYVVNNPEGKVYITSFDSAMNIEVNTANRQLIFKPYVSVPWNSTGLNTAMVTINRFTGGGTGHTLISQQYPCNGDNVLNFYPSVEKILGIQIKGNYGLVKTDITNADGTNSWGIPFNVVWSDDNAFLNVFEKVVDNVGAIGDVVKTNSSYLQSISYSVSSGFSTLNNYVSSIRSSVSTILNKVTAHFPTVESALDNIYRRLGYLVNSPDAEETKEFEQNNNEQANKLDSLNEQNKTEKVEPSDVANDVVGYVDGTAVANYGTVLAIFTNNNYILDCLLVVFAMALVSYALFGKKG